MRHHLLARYTARLTYDKEFVRAIAGIRDGGCLSDRLLPFYEFLTRFDKAASKFFELRESSGADYPMKLTNKHGLAWKEGYQQSPDTIGGNASAKPITALKAAEFISPIADTIIILSHIGDASNPGNLIDVKLGITKLDEVLAAVSDDHSDNNDIEDNHDQNNKLTSEEYCQERYLIRELRQNILARNIRLLLFNCVLQKAYLPRAK
jgi:hypothetical protein